MLRGTGNHKKKKKRKQIADVPELTFEQRENNIKRIQADALIEEGRSSDETDQAKRVRIVYFPVRSCIFSDVSEETGVYRLFPLSLCRGSPICRGCCPRCIFKEP